MNSIRICIIGGGVSGVTACKACVEEGFDVVVYEKTDQTGGLWRYREDVVDGVASVTKSTVINTCKEITAFSDFPPPPEFANYMHNKKMVQYIDLYGQTFGFENYVRLCHEVLKVEPNCDYEETGKWIITVRDLCSGQTFTDVVNGVMVCSGHHSYPLIPTFKDQEKFKGEIIHTHSYRRPEPFECKRVVVVGIGNSGGDAAVDLSTCAEKVYLSTRRGVWLSGRVGPFGKPTESYAMRRIMSMLMYDILPPACLSWITENLLKIHLDLEYYNLRPDYRNLTGHPTVNDSLPNCILSGTVTIKSNIERFTQNGVIFEGETDETLCDVVLLATGYEVVFPFLPPELKPIDNNCVQLYKYMLYPKLKHPKTLAMISLVQPLGSIPPIGEMQSRWFAQLMANKCKLPDTQTMMADIKEKEQFRNRFYDSERHILEVNWLHLLDELAAEIGAKPNLLKYFFTDPKLWRALVFGLLATYQYRLKGPHSWSGARDAILTVEKRMSAPLKTRISIQKQLTKKSNRYIIKALFVFLFIIVLLKYNN